MKSNKLLLIALLLLLGNIASACNSCSQVSVFSSAGFLIQNTLNDNISVQGQCAKFRGQSSEGTISNDNIMSTEHMLKKGINKRMYVWVGVPIHAKQRMVNNDKLYNNGLGDIRLGMDYQFKARSISSAFKIVPVISGGIKTPTGHYEHYLASQGMPRSFNLGTGAWGGFMNPMVLMNYKKWGGMLSGLLYAQTTNKYGYRYGSQSNLSATIYYTFFAKRKVQMLPNFGIALDKVSNDKYNGYTETQTGGGSVLLQIGTSVQSKRHGVSFAYQKPIDQSYANNTTQLCQLYTARYTFLLKKNPEEKL